MLSMRRMGNAWGNVFTTTQTVSACNIVIYKKYMSIQMTDVCLHSPLLAQSSVIPWSFRSDKSDQRAFYYVIEVTFGHHSKVGACSY